MGTLGPRTGLRRLLRRQVSLSVVSTGPSLPQKERGERPVLPWGPPRPTVTEEGPSTLREKIDCVKGVRDGRLSRK